MAIQEATRWFLSLPGWDGSGEVEEVAVVEDNDDDDDKQPEQKRPRHSKLGLKPAAKTAPSLKPAAAKAAQSPKPAVAPTTKKMAPSVKADDAAAKPAYLAVNLVAAPAAKPTAKKVVRPVSPVRLMPAPPATPPVTFESQILPANWITILREEAVDGHASRQLELLYQVDERPASEVICKLTKDRSEPISNASAFVSRMITNSRKAMSRHW